MTVSNRPIVLRVLARGAGAPPTVVIVATLAYLLTALFAPGVVGAALLAVLVVALCWWALVTWRLRPVGARAVQAAVISGLVAAAVAKLVRAAWPMS